MIKQLLAISALGGTVVLFSMLPKSNITEPNRHLPWPFGYVHAEPTKPTHTPTPDPAKGTKAYAKGYVAGKCWARGNDVPDKNQKNVMWSQALQEQLPPSGVGTTVYELQAARNYAQGFVDGVFGN